MPRDTRLLIANKLEHVQQKCACSPLSENRFSPTSVAVNAYALEQLKLHTFRKRQYRFDALFLNQVYHGSKLCPSI
jgi:hypothetical protein